MKQSDFGTLLTRYLSHHLPVQRNLSVNTIKSYRDTFKQLLKYCRDEKKLKIAKITIKQIDKRFIEDYLIWLRQERKISTSTYNQRLSAIHAFFDYVMVEEPEYIEHCQRIIKIKAMETPEKPAVYLTGSNLQLLLAEPDTNTRKGRRHLAILTVLYDTAARVSELTDVKVRDVRLEAPACITLHGKGDKIRTVPLMKQSVAILTEYLAENRINPRLHGDLPLFWGNNRRKLTRSGITYIVQKYAGQASNSSVDMPLKITPHILRHTKAMHMVQTNVHPIYIKDHLGHADITTTQVYAKAENEVKREVLEQAAGRLELPQVTNWEHDDRLIEWLDSLG
ncbi:MAG: site-specific integrase [Clostridiales bacterium]|jgi:site-specific recombinase XerD|nr:site-specific integrase [Clostridiales bacterium]